MRRLAAVLAIAVCAACVRPVSVASPVPPPATQVAVPPAAPDPTQTLPPTAPAETAAPAAPTGAETPAAGLDAGPEAVEARPVIIPLGGVLADPDAELSGLAWYGHQLVLLPQYPERFPGSSDGSVFVLDKSAILAYLDGKTTAPLEPRPAPFATGSIGGQIKGYEGFEAIAISGDSAYLTIEASPLAMQGYLVSAAISPDGPAMSLDTTRLGAIDPQSLLPNLADEAILLLGKRILTFYEANGQNINQHPVAHLFDTALQLQDTLAFPTIEYRLTDATQPDDSGRFWMINLFNPVDVPLFPADDLLFEAYGKGPTHSKSKIVERLVEMQISESGIVVSDTPPIQIELDAARRPRNWEGIVRLDDRGFLLVTDSHPETLLAFIPFP